MMKSKMKLLCLVFTMMLCMSMTSLTAFASSTEDNTEEDTATTSAETYSLTPEGNLTLVDDVETNSTEDKQFITMQSKNGNYFYLVIDRSGDTDNVYFLNLVDEADLLALIEDEPQVESTPTVATSNTTGTTDLTETESTTTNSTTGETTDAEASSSMVLAVVGLVALLGGGIFYYFKFMKPKKNTSKATTDFDDFEFEDEDEDTDEEEYGFDFEDNTIEEMENEYE